ncbi:MAG TPA: TIGR03943 family protein [Actinomycetota bacterium]|nr:TIGR03943 family protein [Actinomycetota bacterium]
MSAITGNVATRVSPVRIAAAIVLGAWGVMFWMLWLTGRTYLYLSSRTAWVVPMGAVIMSIAAIGRLATARSARQEVLGRRQAWSLGIVALPVVLVLALPPSALGAYSVGKRATFGGSAIGATARDVTGPLDFVDIGAAQSFPAAMTQLEARAGEPIALEGFVTHKEGAPLDEIVLTRYIVTCCVADATIAQVRVVGLPPGAYTDDEWLRITGAVYPVGREVLVAADSAEPIPVPEQPYLTP